MEDSKIPLPYCFLSKKKKTWFLQTHRNQVFTFLLMSQDLYKIYKTPNIVKQEKCAEI